MSSVTTAQDDVRSLHPRPESHERPRVAPPPLPPEARAHGHRAARDEDDRTTRIFQRSEPVAAYEVATLTRDKDEPTDTLRMTPGQLRVLLAWLRGVGDATGPRFPVDRPELLEATAHADCDAVDGVAQPREDHGTASGDASIEVTVVASPEPEPSTPAKNAATERALVQPSPLAVSASSPSFQRRFGAACRRALLRALHLLVAVLVPLMVRALGLWWWSRGARGAGKPIAALPANIEAPPNRNL